jgi:heme/copper-type cytochrome/quinol oxidase subunit 2
LPARSRTRLVRRSIALAGALVLTAPSAALAGAVTPAAPASPAAEDTRIAYLVMLVVATLLALAVIVGIVVAVRRGRGVDVPERRTKGTAGLQGRVGLALGLLAAAALVFGIVVTESARDADAANAEAEASDEVRILATGQQWLWRYEYPDGTFSFHELVVPVDTPIVLDVSSIDVLHRWWVPALGPMVDAAPGETTELAFRAEDVGTYEGRSTRFSGPAFAAMRTRVRVVPQAEYDAWLERQSSEITDAQNEVAEETERRQRTADQADGADEGERDLEPGPAEGNE